MAIIKTKARQDTSVSRVSEGGDVYVRSTRDGALFTADWKQAMVMEGRGFIVNVGALTSPAKGGGTGNTKPDTDSPEIQVSIPDGTTFIPLRMEVEVGQATAATTADETDILICADLDATLLGLGAGTAETAYNLNTLHSRTSNCTILSENSDNLSTAPTRDIEYAHAQKVSTIHSAVGADWTNLTLLYEPEVSPLINGPACFLIYWGGTVATYGFCAMQWLEIPTSMI